MRMASVIVGIALCIAVQAAGEGPCATVFAQAEKNVTPGVILNESRVEQTRATIRGTANSVEEIATYVDALKRNRFFRSVELKSVKASAESWRFEIQLTVR